MLACICTSDCWNQPNSSTHSCCKLVFVTNFFGRWNPANGIDRYSGNLIRQLHQFTTNHLNDLSFNTPRNGKRPVEKILTDNNNYESQKHTINQSRG